jgi:hypothetical protein
MVYLWRAVDAECEVLDVLVQSKRNKYAALQLMRRLWKKYGLVATTAPTTALARWAMSIPTSIRMVPCSTPVAATRLTKAAQYAGQGRRPAGGSHERLPLRPPIK